MGGGLRERSDRTRALPEEHFRLQAVLLLQEPPGRLRNVPPGCSGQRRGGLLAVLGLGQDLWGGGAPFLHAGHAPPSPEPAGLRRELCSPERTAGSRRGPWKPSLAKWPPCGTARLASGVRVRELRRGRCRAGRVPFRGSRNIQRRTAA